MNGQILWLLLVQFAGFQAISGLKCYECSSDTDPYCDSRFLYKEGSEEADAITVKCGPLYDVCTKTTSPFYTDKGTKKTVVIRACGADSSTTKRSVSGFSVVTCIGRDADLFPCNRQGRVMPIIVLLALGLLLFAMLG